MRCLGPPQVFPTRCLAAAKSGWRSLLGGVLSASGGGLDPPRRARPLWGGSRPPRESAPSFLGGSRDPARSEEPLRPEPGPPPGKLYILASGGVWIPQESPPPLGPSRESTPPEATSTRSNTQHHPDVPTECCQREIPCGKRQRVPQKMETGREAREMVLNNKLNDVFRHAHIRHSDDCAIFVRL